MSVHSPFLSQQFFQNLKKPDPHQKPNLTRKYAIKHIEELATHTPYTVVANDPISVEQEFHHLFNILKHDQQTTDEDWLYCYYCCILLSAFYHVDANNDPAKYQQFSQLASTIEQRYETGHFPAEEVNHWKKQLTDDINDLLSTPWHLSKLRNWIGLSNAYRILFTFSRITTQQGLSILEQEKWLNTLSHTLKIRLNLTEMNARLNAPKPIFLALSVGLFLARLTINLSLIIKHTFLPNEKERQSTAWNRFYQEFKKYDLVILNDIAWAIINALTNYPDFFKINSSTANTLLTTFLLFDISVLTYRLYDANQRYLQKRSQYEIEKKQLERLINAKQQTTPDELHQLYHRLSTINKQLEQLELDMEATRATFHASLVAAALLATGWSASLIFAAPAVALAGYFTIVLGTALYLSADAYGHYAKTRKKQLHLSWAADPSLEQHASKQLSTETQAAWNAFTLSLAKNTAIPLLLMGVLAVSWQAALVLVVLHMGYQCYETYRPNVTIEAPAEKAMCTP